MESEQPACVARIVALAEYVWQDPEDARKFLTAPHLELGDRPPIEAAADGSGAGRVEQILQRILHGLPA